MPSTGASHNNSLMIASAGAGKSTYLVREALKQSPEETVLITTYTERNEQELKLKFIKEVGAVPANVTIQSWFSFLIEHGVKPFQGSLNSVMYTFTIRGMKLVNEPSGYKLDRFGKKIFVNGRPVQWSEKTDFRRHYFDKQDRIYSDKVSKFAVSANQETGGMVASRISRIFSQIYIDEVQDLAGYDLEFIRLLLKSSSRILMVGDPRQVTYLTHHPRKHPKYKDGKIKEFLEEKCARLIKGGIDERTLSYSHRNNIAICGFSSRLFPALSKSSPCTCSSCHDEKISHQGVFLVRPKDVDFYLAEFSPVQLRNNKSVSVNGFYDALNFGESKGVTLSRVLIYPTKEYVKWLKNPTHSLKPTSRSKFYVAITRAEHSVAIVYDYKAGEVIPGTINYSPPSI